ncbi:MAG: 7-cyano-7-deazaguanine synthase QueC [Candidatus Coatesbacteria bacterium]|nr:MAG: 7-cyano-7-deazaguanine synthase QueC [Candidatus Coatesbacteria bacterium]RLC43588.1 MAG: 7-cyano-7-deazaguanine synthase QueC [Candidatus Coatesbacteria bacterium]
MRILPTRYQIYREGRRRSVLSRSGRRMRTVQNTDHRCVALLSGGLDSALATLLAVEEYEQVLALTFDYGQKPARMEIEASGEIARYLSIERQVIKLDIYRDFAEMAHLPLISGVTSDEDISYWMPNRNGVMIEVASAIAEGVGASYVVVGFNADEAQSFLDNTTEYLDALNHALEYSTQGRVKVISPTVNMTKSEILDMLHQSGFPIKHIYPCYTGEELLCGECPSCRKFISALKKVGIYDRFSWRFADAT